MITISSDFANSSRPPAVAISCRTVIVRYNGYWPVLATIPVMKTWRLLIWRTTTVAVGSVTKWRAASTSLTRNSSAVSPAAGISLMSGRVIRPSGSTATSPESSFSRQKTIPSTSPSPMT